MKNATWLKCGLPHLTIYLPKAAKTGLGIGAWMGTQMKERGFTRLQSYR